MRWSRGPNPSVNLSQALNVWWIQAIVAIGPPLGGLVFTVYMKTDWGISLFFLVPLALVAIPRCAFRRRAVSHHRDLARALARHACRSAAHRACCEMEHNPNSANSYGSRSQLARELTQVWHQQFGSRWAVVAGTTEVGEPMTFYSPDHPAPVHAGRSLVVGTDVAGRSQAPRLHRHLRHDRRTPAGLREVDEGKRARRPEQIMTTQRFFKGHPGPSIAWKIYIQPPAK